MAFQSAVHKTKLQLFDIIIIAGSPCIIILLHCDKKTCGSTPALVIEYANLYTTIR